MSDSQEEILDCIAANPGIRLSEIEEKLKISSGHHKIHSLMKQKLIRRDVRRGGGSPWFAYFVETP
jgi:predicted transcriptional regulator